MSEEYREGELYGYYRSLPTVIGVFFSDDTTSIKWPDGTVETFFKNSDKDVWFRRLVLKNKDYRA